MNALKMVISNEIRMTSSVIKDHIIKEFIKNQLLFDTFLYWKTFYELNKYDYDQFVKSYIWPQMSLKATLVF